MKVRAALSLMLVLAMGTSVLAQDLVPWPNRQGANEPIRLKDHTMNATIRNQVAEVTIEPTFHNPNTQELEGMFFTHLPAGAQVKDFRMTVNGKEVSAELLDSDKARGIYNSIVQQRRDPAILELVGHQMIKARVYPIQGNSDVKIKIVYTQILEAEEGMVRFTAPFARQVSGSTQVSHASLLVKIESKAGIKSIYSPTHRIDTARKDDHNALVSYEATKYSADRDFNLYYTVSESEIGANLITFREAGEDGFFALLLSPKVEIAKEKILPKDVIFVFDRSGSMSGEKIQQARASLRFCIERLTERDRFNVVDFSTTAESFESELVPGTKENIARARRYVGKLEAAGSTDIDGALQMALGMMKDDPSRVSMMLFATDGLPTAGEQNLQKILGNVLDKNKDGALGRVFVFGVGRDVNTLFLDQLAEKTRGARDYVQPQEDIEEKVASLYRKVSSPILSGIRLDFGDVLTEQIYPRNLPDIFKGSQLVVFGRYTGSGRTALRLQGMAGGEMQTMDYQVHFPEKATRDDFLPRLWAGRKVAFLIDNIRMSGRADKELVDEIVRLGKRYGIVTPYTSFLITEDQIAQGGGAGAKYAEELAKKGKKLHDRAANSGRPAAPAESEKAQQESKDLREAGEADDAEALEAFADKAMSEARRRGQKIVTEVRTVGAKTFYKRLGVWYDGLYDPEKHKDVVEIEFLGDAYFKLIQDNTGIQKYLALGSDIYVLYGGKLYHVAPKSERKDEEKKEEK